MVSHVACVATVGALTAGWFYRDRVPFLTKVRTGTPSYVPATNEIHHNFIVSDGDADGGAIDNDDGSSFYDEHHNFAVYGGAKMGNIDGHGKVTHHNVYAFPNVYGEQQCRGSTSARSGRKCPVFKLF